MEADHDFYDVIRSDKRDSCKKNRKLHLCFYNSRNDPRYKDGPSDAEFPTCESLKLTIERTLPYWNEVSADQSEACIAGDSQSEQRMRR